MPVYIPPVPPPPRRRRRVTPTPDLRLPGQAPAPPLPDQVPVPVQAEREGVPVPIGAEIASDIAPGVNDDFDDGGARRREEEDIRLERQRQADIEQAALLDEIDDRDSVRARYVLPDGSVTDDRERALAAYAQLRGDFIQGQFIDSVDDRDSVRATYVLPDGSTTQSLTEARRIYGQINRDRQESILLDNFEEQRTQERLERRLEGYNARQQALAREVTQTLNTFEAAGQSNPESVRGVLTAQREAYQDLAERYPEFAGNARQNIDRIDTQIFRVDTPFPQASRGQSAVVRGELGYLDDSIRIQKEAVEFLQDRGNAAQALVSPELPPGAAFLPPRRGEEPEVDPALANQTKILQDYYDQQDALKNEVDPDRVTRYNEFLNKGTSARLGGPEFLDFGVAGVTTANLSPTAQAAAALELVRHPDSSGGADVTPNEAQFIRQVANTYQIFGPFEALNLLGITSIAGGLAQAPRVLISNVGRKEAIKRLPLIFRQNVAEEGVEQVAEVGLEAAAFGRPDFTQAAVESAIFIPLETAAEFGRGVRAPIDSTSLSLERDRVLSETREKRRLENAIRAQAIKAANQRPQTKLTLAQRFALGPVGEALNIGGKPLPKTLSPSQAASLAFLTPTAVIAAPAAVPGIAAIESAQVQSGVEASSQAPSQQVAQTSPSAAQITTGTPAVSRALAAEVQEVGYDGAVNEVVDAISEAGRLYEAGAFTEASQVYEYAKSVAQASQSQAETAEQAAQSQAAVSVATAEQATAIAEQAVNNVQTNQSAAAAAQAEQAVSVAEQAQQQAEVAVAQAEQVAVAEQAIAQQQSQQQTQQQAQTQQQTQQQIQTQIIRRPKRPPGGERAIQARGVSAGDNARVGEWYGVNHNQLDFETGERRITPVSTVAADTFQVTKTSAKPLDKTYYAGALKIDVNGKRTRADSDNRIEYRRPRQSGPRRNNRDEDEDENTLPTLNVELV